MTLRYINLHATCDACDDDFVIRFTPGDDWPPEPLPVDFRSTNHLCDDCAEKPAAEPPPPIPPDIDVTIRPRVGYRVIMAAVRDLPEEKGEYLGANGDVATVRVDEQYREPIDDDGLREVLLSELEVDLPELSAAQLLEIHNEKAAMLGIPQPKKFKDKITALTRLAALIAHIEQPAETP